MTSSLFKTLDHNVQSYLRDVARDIIMPAFLQAIPEEMIAIKNDHSIVTAIDHQAQHALKPCLMDLIPGSGFLGEEDDLTDPRTLRDYEWLWILDPIDGTHNFAYQKPDFGTMLALWHVPDGRPIYGWIYMPVTDRLFSGGTNEGVFLNGAPLDDATRHAVTSFDQMRGLLNYRSFGHAHDTMSRNSNVFRSVEPSSCAAAKFVDLLLGEADFAAFGRAKIWDLAAGFALLAALGGRAGRVLDPAGSQNLSIWNPKSYSEWYLAVRDVQQWASIREQLFADIAHDPIITP